MLLSIRQSVEARGSCSGQVIADFCVIFESGRAEYNCLVASDWAQTLTLVFEPSNEQCVSRFCHVSIYQRQNLPSFLAV